MDRDTLERVRRDMSDRTNWRSQIELDDIIGLCDFAEQHMDPPADLVADPRAAEHPEALAVLNERNKPAA